MSNFFFTKANLKRLSKKELYKILYAQFTTPLTRGQVIYELQMRIPHHTWLDRNNKVNRMWDENIPEYQTLKATVWEIEQADLLITAVNGGN